MRDKHAASVLSLLTTCTPLALFQFDARNEHELTVRRGEELKLLALKGGFVHVRNPLKTEGWFVLLAALACVLRARFALCACVRV